MSAAIIAVGFWRGCKDQIFAWCKLSQRGEDSFYLHMAKRFKVQEETAFAISVNKWVKPTWELPCSQPPDWCLSATEVEDHLLVIFAGGHDAWLDLVLDVSECSKNKVVFEWQHGSTHFNNNLLTQFCVKSLERDRNQPALTHLWMKPFTSNEFKDILLLKRSL